MFTQEQRKVAHEFIINKFIIMMIERDIKLINKSNLVTKQLNLVIYEDMRKFYINERKKIRTEMNKEKFNVIEECRDEDFISFKMYNIYTEEVHNYFLMAIKIQCMKRIMDYFNIEDNQPKFY